MASPPPTSRRTTSRPSAISSGTSRRTWTTLTDNRGPNTTTLTFTPGFRTYVGWNLYWFGGVELPVTQPKPFDYQVLTELPMPF